MQSEKDMRKTRYERHCIGIKMP